MSNILAVYYLCSRDIFYVPKSDFPESQIEPFLEGPKSRVESECRFEPIDSLTHRTLGTWDQVRNKGEGEKNRTNQEDEVIELEIDDDPLFHASAPRKIEFFFLLRLPLVPMWNLHDTDPPKGIEVKYQDLPLHSGQSDLAQNRTLNTNVSSNPASFSIHGLDKIKECSNFAGDGTLTVGVISGH